MNISEKKGGVLLSYFSMGSNLLVKILYTPILLRLMGQADYGLYSLVISIVGYLSILDLGFGSTVTRYTIEYRNRDDGESLGKLYGTLSLIYVIIGLIAFLTCSVLSVFADGIFGEAMTDTEIGKLRIMILLCGINLLFSFPLQISASVIIAYERFIFRNGVTLLLIFIEPIVMLFLLYAFRIDSVGAVYITTLFNILRYGAYYIYAYKKLGFRFSWKKFDKTIINKLLSFSAAMFLLMIFEQLQYNSGQFVLGMFHGSETVAVWGVAMIFVLNYRSISSAVTNVVTPAYLESDYSDYSQGLHLLTRKVTRIQTYLLFTILLNFVLFGKYFILLWAGENYIEAYDVSIVIMIPMTIALIFEFCYLCQMATNKLKYRIWTLYICYVIAFCVIKFFFGITLLSYAFIVSLSLFLGQVLCVCIYIIKWTHFDLAHIVLNICKVAVAPILLCIIYHTIEKFIFPANFSISSFIISIMVFNILLFSTFWLLSMDNAEKQMIIRKK